MPIDGLAEFGTPSVETLDLAPHRPLRGPEQFLQCGGRDPIPHRLGDRGRIRKRQMSRPPIARAFSRVAVLDAQTPCPLETDAARNFPRNAEGGALRAQLIQLLPEITQVARRIVWHSRWRSGRGMWRPTL